MSTDPGDGEARRKLARLREALARAIEEVAPDAEPGLAERLREELALIERLLSWQSLLPHAATAVAARKAAAALSDRRR
jgi:hypothetical protein